MSTFLPLPLGEMYTAVRESTARGLQRCVIKVRTWGDFARGILQKYGLIDSVHRSILCSPTQACNGLYNQEIHCFTATQSLLDDQGWFLGVYIGWPGKVQVEHVFKKCRLFERGLSLFPGWHTVSILLTKLYIHDQRQGIQDAQKQCRTGLAPLQCRHAVLLLLVVIV